MTIMQILRVLVDRFPDAGWYILDLGGPLSPSKLLEWIEQDSITAWSAGKFSAIPGVDIIVVVACESCLPLFVATISPEEVPKAWQLAEQFEFR